MVRLLREIASLPSRFRTETSDEKRQLERRLRELADDLSAHAMLQDAVEGR